MGGAFSADDAIWLWGFQQSLEYGDGKGSHSCTRLDKLYHNETELCILLLQAEDDGRLGIVALRCNVMMAPIKVILEGGWQRKVLLEVHPGDVSRLLT